MIGWLAGITLDDKSGRSEICKMMDKDSISYKNSVIVHSHERVDDLHRKGYVLIQNPNEFCFGIDAVILSGFARVKKGETVLDLGTGTGVIPILLEAKTEGCHFTGLEIQPQMVEMARRSVKLNGLEEKITIVEGDIKRPSYAGFLASSFSVVTCNPPYMNSGGGLVNPESSIAIARHELLCSLEDVVRAAARMLAVNGRFYMVHRPQRLVDIIALLREYKVEPKRLQFVHPYADKEPNLMLIEAVKGGKPFLKAEPPLVIYANEGMYTEEIKDIYYN